jgi:hypothetical protein
MGTLSIARKKPHEYIDRRFTRLVIAEYIAGSQGKRARARCKCDCGNEVVVIINNLTRGLTKSCGCLNDETRVAVNTKHGLTESSEHHIWSAMLQRCTNPKHTYYHNYGGRGIRVCERWLEFENFLADMGRRPSPRHTLDRKDNDGDYCPDNCKWSTREEQCRNRRYNVRLTINNETKLLVEWAEEYGLKPSTVRRRLRVGCTPEQAIGPLKKQRRTHGRNPVNT